MNDSMIIRGVRGRSASREVVLGFAPARLLHALSFADVLNEESGTGYQRRFADRHSLDFRRYVQQPGSTTIPLTFNLRPAAADKWRLKDNGGGIVELVVPRHAGKVLAQVDCQHRLGHIGDLDVELPFMIFIGLTEREEMEIFNVINSKAMGLSGSLLDYHQSHLVADLSKERPELFIALHLNESPISPWYKQLDLGGTRTSGLARRASLRTMQKAVKRFLTQTDVLDVLGPEDTARLVLEFWIAVTTVLRQEWMESRRHFLTKGVGVYALMGLLGDFWNERESTEELGTRRFLALLSDFATDFDWSNSGPLKGLGGEAGAQEALELLRAARHDIQLRVRRLAHAG